MHTTHTASAKGGAVDSAVKDAITRIPGLTERQYQVLKAYCEGPTDKMLAQRLGISVFTVRDHLCAIKSHLGIDSRAIIGIVSYLMRSPSIPLQN